MTLLLKFKKLHSNATIPTKAKEGDLGWDLYTSENIEISEGTNQLVKTGIACQFPAGYGAILKDRSGLSSKNRLYVHAGVIDNGYTGEIQILLDFPMNPYDNNVRYTSLIFPAGTKIAQMIIVPVIEVVPVVVTELTTTERGASGFGSSGT
jgi:dUTP pyrophosphatase